MLAGKCTTLRDSNVAGAGADMERLGYRAPIAANASDAPPTEFSVIYVLYKFLKDPRCTHRTIPKHEISARLACRRGRGRSGGSERITELIGTSSDALSCLCCVLKITLLMQSRCAPPRTKGASQRCLGLTLSGLVGEASHH